MAVAMAPITKVVVFWQKTIQFKVSSLNLQIWVLGTLFEQRHILSVIGKLCLRHWLRESAHCLLRLWKRLLELSSSFANLIMLALLK